MSGPRFITGSMLNVWYDPDLSVGIVNWNTKDYLRGCLNSIRDNLKGLTAEVIVAIITLTTPAVLCGKGEFPWVNGLKTGQTLDTRRRITGY